MRCEMPDGVRWDSVAAESEDRLISKAVRELLDRILTVR
jgi:hypothetical protein